MGLSRFGAVYLIPLKLYNQSINKNDKNSNQNIKIVKSLAKFPPIITVNQSFVALISGCNLLFLDLP